MEERFAAFTVLIAKINRNIRRIKTEEMAEFHLKGPHVACLYHLTTAGPLTAGELCDRCDEDKACHFPLTGFFGKGRLSGLRQQRQKALSIAPPADGEGRGDRPENHGEDRPGSSGKQAPPDGGGAGRDVSRAFRRQRAAGPNGGNQNERGGPAG